MGLQIETLDPTVLGLVGLAGAPVVLALVQVVKVSFPRLPARFLPALTLAVGLALNVFLALGLGETVWSAAVLGIVTGLTASGLYSHAKAGFPKGQGLETRNM